MRSLIHSSIHTVFPEPQLHTGYCACSGSKLQLHTGSCACAGSERQLHTGSCARAGSELQLHTRYCACAGRAALMASGRAGEYNTTPQL